PMLPGHAGTVSCASACRCRPPARLLLNRQTVGVRAKSPCRAFPIFIDGDHTSAAAAEMLQSNIVESLFDELLRLIFLRGKLRVLVQAPVGGDHFLTCLSTQISVNHDPKIRLATRARAALIKIRGKIFRISSGAYKYAHETRSYHHRRRCDPHSGERSYRSCESGRRTFLRSSRSRPLLEGRYRRILVEAEG